MENGTEKEVKTLPIMDKLDVANNIIDTAIEIIGNKK